MSELEISFESGESSLSVRTFAVEERLSEPFRADIVAMSPDDDIDLEPIVGKKAVFRITGGLLAAEPRSRSWSGVVSDMRQVRVEPAGLSTYEITLVPSVWLLSQRRGNRLFQHVSIPDIVDRLLGEWAIAHRWQIDRAAYPRLELRVQYGETDLHFLDRLLEEAGITYFFADDGDRGCVLVLSDGPQSAPPRALPLPFVDDASLANAGQIEHLTQVALGRSVRPGKVTLRDFDFRRPDFPLFSQAPPSAGDESRYEVYAYEPSRFLMETNKDLPLTSLTVADDRGTARFEESFGTGAAARRLESLRASRHRVAYRTNALDLRPGVVFRMANHPRADLAVTRPLLAAESRLSGEVGKEFVYHGEAVPADEPYRPLQRTPKPHIFGVQSAVVVGPPGEEIYTDEAGRVRVQFHWDREGKRDPDSSIWMRVSQGWAGAGFGAFTLPRVGHEVLVAYLDGDPDSPIVVGRVHNLTSGVPFSLPDNKTVSTIRTHSSPNSGGFNELRFEDAAGREMIFEHAERDKNQLVKNDQRIAVGGNQMRMVQGNDTVAVGDSRTKAVQLSEVEAVGLHRTTTIGVNRNTVVGGDDATVVGSKFSVSMGRGLTGRLPEEMQRLMKGPLGSTLHSAVRGVLGAIPHTPLGGALSATVDGPLASLGEAAASAFRSVMGAIEGRTEDPGPPPTRFEMVDRKITLSTGEASIVLDGPNITFFANGNVMMHAKKNAGLLADNEACLAAEKDVLVVSRSSDVITQAAKIVHLNPVELSPDPVPLDEELRLADAVLPEETCPECGAPMVAVGEDQKMCMMDVIRAEQKKDLESGPRPPGMEE
jgi:type VI secretion system secreted protein VgrG